MKEPGDGPSASGEITELLRAAADGNESAREELYALVFHELRRVARAQLAKSGSRTVDATSLVHEAYLKLFGGRPIDVVDRAHFFALNARAMRQVLIDHYRRRGAERRGGGERPVTLRDTLVGGGGDHVVELLALDEALERLERIDPRSARVVECRFFAGMEEREIAEVVGVTTRTVRNDWRKARTWLGARLGVVETGGDSGRGKSR